MRRTNFSVHLLCTSLMLLSAVSADTALANDGVEIRQATLSSDGKDVGETRIVVDGPNTSRYTEVINDTLDIWVAVSLDKSTNHNAYQQLTLTAENESIPGELHAGTRRYKFTLPYADPNSVTVANQRNSPVAACNAQLEDLQGAARSSFLREGKQLRIADAYRLKAVATYTTTHKGKKHGVFGDAPRFVEVTNEDSAYAGATIECRPLDRPRAHTKTTTQGAPPRPGKKMEPTIAGVSLRIEPAAKETIDKQICPTQLRLYGGVEASRAFHGKALFFGAHYLSPITVLNFDKAGQRSFVSTYPLKWTGIGGLANGPAAKPKSQTVSLKLSVANDDNKSIEHAEQTVTISCEPIVPTRLSATAIPRRAPTPTAPSDPQLWTWHEAARMDDGAAIGSAATENQADFDVAIRRVDREGPSQATRLWLRNAGPDQATNCTLAVQRMNEPGWYRVMAIDLAPGTTEQVAGPLPGDQALEFKVMCPGEAQERLANNQTQLP